ncbi:TetR family transcriptional regulator [Cohnella terricola]|uniref:acyl-CoA-like ligand-binding transcription factor n=1 Tax=Cohnella terricola TaxID=1289167 RepID=UPI001FED201C|nr:TetR family transcriptional regulator [Cohnella terricola]
MTLDDQPKLGLRERKKLKTRAIIQQNAIRLFREQGYQETTVEQIAAASEISPSTFFRYFQTKEAVVIEDDFDPMLIELYRRQPPELDPIETFRRAVIEGAALISDEDRKAVRIRMELMSATPELRAAFMSQTSSTLTLIADLIAERTGRHNGDLGVYALAGAVVGATMGAHAYCERHPEADYIETIVSALESVETAFRA